MPSPAGESLVVNGIVREPLPSALFRVELQDASRSVTVHVGGDAGLLRLQPGDAVVVALHPYDVTRGRIVKRCS